MKIVVMGVTGSGKSTIGSILAKSLDVKFIDGDNLHSDRNRQKMSSGVPLNDDDRWPWLEAVANELQSNASLVIACSALKKIYREKIRLSVPETQFILLNVPNAQLKKRLEVRTAHFMSPDLLQSQIELLESLEPDERGFVIQNDRPFSEVINGVLDRIAYEK